MLMAKFILKRIALCAGAVCVAVRSPAVVNPFGQKTDPIPIAKTPDF